MASDESWREATDGVRRLGRKRERSTREPDPGEARLRLRARLKARPAEPVVYVPDKDAAPRRVRAVEARLDLHGLPEAEAHRALIEFVTEARAEGCSRVLIVTGKGRDPGGALKQNVPRWMEVSPLDAMVRSITAATPRQGGEGALVVTLHRDPS